MVFTSITLNHFNRSHEKENSSAYVINEMYLLQ